MSASSARIVGVVVAAGGAERFGGRVPKQFLDIGGRSMLSRAVGELAAHRDIGGVVVVLAPEHARGAMAEEVRGWPGVLAVVAGGDTRARSALRGVRAARGAEFVLVHDAARPLASADLVDAVVRATVLHGAAIPGLPVPDTVKELNPQGTVDRTLARSRLRLAQTPQGSRTEWLTAALEAAERRGAEVTDEAAALEMAGHRVVVVPGERQNLKITTRADLDRAREIVEGRNMTLRIGTGFDVHRFGAERPLVLGGVEFPGEAGLEGHSDADVVLHAVMDALLGAASLGDIGAHFPPGDPEFAGAASTALAARVAETVRAAGWEPVNVDATVLAERPRIRARAEEMRGSIASCLGMEPGRVGVKATTLEGLGALGRAEGIGCQAVALLHGRTRE